MSNENASNVSPERVAEIAQAIKSALPEPMARLSPLTEQQRAIRKRIAEEEQERLAMKIEDEIRQRQSEAQEKAKVARVAEEAKQLRQQQTDYLAGRQFAVVKDFGYSQNHIMMYFKAGNTLTPNDILRLINDRWMRDGKLDPEFFLDISDAGGSQCPKCQHVHAATPMTPEPILFKYHQPKLTSDSAKKMLILLQEIPELATLNPATGRHTVLVGKIYDKHREAGWGDALAELEKYHFVSIYEEHAGNGRPPKVLDVIDIRLTTPETAGQALKELQEKLNPELKRQELDWALYKLLPKCMVARCDFWFPGGYTENEVRVLSGQVLDETIKHQMISRKIITLDNFDGNQYVEEGTPSQVLRCANVMCRHQYIRSAITSQKQ